MVPGLPYEKLDLDVEIYISTGAGSDNVVLQKLSYLGLLPDLPNLTNFEGRLTEWPMLSGQSVLLEREL